jgi:two-component system response regulator AtoC
MKRVLILEDQPRLRRALQVLVERIGAAPCYAESVEAALAICGNQQIDLVVSDLKMAPIDDLEFLRRLRSLGWHVPVIILTAFGTISTAIEAMKLGAFDFVQKPVDNEALEIVIRKALDVSRDKVERSFHLD